VELADESASPRHSTWRWLVLLVVRLGMDAALVTVCVQTWTSGSPARIWVAAPIALYLFLSLWALKQGSRLAAPGIVTQTPAPFYLWLGLLAGLTQVPEWQASGVVAFGQLMPALVTATVLAVVALAMVRSVTSRGAAWWYRLVLAAVGAYAGTALTMGLMHGVPLASLLRGHSEWSAMPPWLQGAHVGALLLVPFAFVRELFLSMKLVVLRGYFRWMVVFALGVWIVVNVLSLPNP
jgi:hypothetical protein